MVGPVLGTLEKPCEAPVISPISPQGVGISDEEVIIWFFKPLTDQYDYLIVYKDAAGKQQHTAYWTTYGPVWADFLTGFKPKGPCRAKISLLCYNDKAVKTENPVKVTVTLLDKCKHLFFCIVILSKPTGQMI